MSAAHPQVHHFPYFARPYITLKWAESSDRYIDYSRTDGKPVILSSPLTSMLVHKKRAEHSAILVGTRTAELDNPGLNVRHWYGRSPVRIVLDRQQKLSPSLHLFDGSVPTLVFYRSPARSATECRVSASQRLPAECTPRNHGNAVYTRITIPFGRGWQPNSPILHRCRIVGRNLCGRNSVPSSFRRQSTRNQ